MDCRTIPACGAIIAQRTVLILAISIAVLLGALAGYFVASRRHADDASETRTLKAPSAPAPSPPAVAVINDGVAMEKARIIRSLAAETWNLREDPAAPQAGSSQETHGEHEQIRAALAESRAETARYRQLVVDIENKAPPPILLGAAEPDDLKLIVGIGPVLERMLHNLGIGSFRQIAHWSERDIAEFDAKLPEFPGRITRDQWVTQARALHESKYGERP
jgi:predicted flap endonuclease-1-like 5' DNA nuclease